MKAEEVFKRYDIRGKYPEELNEEFAELLGKALGTFTARNYREKVVLGRDNKETSRPLKEALVKGIRSTGVNVIDVGIGPTDFVALSGKENDAVSVQVTSSHMPLEFNGFKFMYPEGNGFVNEDLYTVKDLFRDREFREGDGAVEKDAGAMDRYREKIRDFAENLGSDWDKNIVIDSLGGTGEILPDILEKLGAEVIDLNDREGIYMDPPNPKPEKLDRLKEKVEEEDADLGIANDLDADRITVYCDGRFLTGDEIFSIIAQLTESPFVASVDTSQALEEFGEVHYTRVGDPFVMDKALEIDADLAGEPNGHYSLTKFVPYNSGVLTGAILAGLDLDKYLEEIPDYHTERTAVTGVEDKEERMKRIIEEVRERFTVESEIDGVKYSARDSSVLIRPSGSSPKIRIIGESKSSEELKAVMQEAEELVRNA